MLYRVRILFILVMSHTFLGQHSATEIHSHMLKKHGGVKPVFGYHGYLKKKSFEGYQFISDSSGRVVSYSRRCELEYWKNLQEIEDRIQERIPTKMMSLFSYGKYDKYSPPVVHVQLPPQFMGKITHAIPHSMIHYRVQEALPDHQGYSANLALTHKDPTKYDSGPMLVAVKKASFPFKLQNKIGEFIHVVNGKNKQAPALLGGGSLTVKPGPWPVVELSNGDLQQHVQVIKLPLHLRGKGQHSPESISGSNDGTGSEHFPEVLAGGSDVGHGNIQVIDVVPGALPFGNENEKGGSGNGAALGSGAVLGGETLGIDITGGSSGIGDGITGVSKKSGAVLKKIGVAKSIDAGASIKKSTESSPIGLATKRDNIVGIPISTNRKLFKERQLSKTHNPFLSLMTLQAFGPGPYRLCKPPAVVVCDARPGWEHVDGMTSWCQQNCVVYSYSTYCDDNRCFCKCTSGK